jgi:hypothetical protein
MVDIHYASSNRKLFSGSSAYRLADRAFSADVAFPELAAFRSSQAPARPEKSLPGRPTRSTHPNMIFHGPGRIGNQVADVQCLRFSDGYRLAVGGAGAFGINSQGNEIVLRERAPQGSTDALNEVVLGPALILALALQGTWCLHASAVTFGQQVICILGRSGSGKSTLAAFLDNSESPCRRVADDILPVSLGRDGVDALSHFPQLKLPPARQPSTDMPERMSLSAIYVIANSATAGQRPEAKSLTAQEAALAMVRLTVATRIFDSKLLAHHLAFCANAIAHIPVRQLDYPRSFDMLPRVGELLAADLQTLNASSHGRYCDG